METKDYTELVKELDESLKEDFSLLEKVEQSDKYRNMRMFLEATTGGVVVEKAVQGLDGVSVLFGYLPGKAGYQLYMKQEHWKFTMDERVKKVRKHAQMNSIGYVIMPIEKKEFKIYPYFPREEGQCEYVIEQLRKEVLEQ